MRGALIAPAFCEVIRAISMVSTRGKPQSEVIRPIHTTPDVRGRRTLAEMTTLALAHASDRAGALPPPRRFNRPHWVATVLDRALGGSERF